VRKAQRQEEEYTRRTSLFNNIRSWRYFRTELSSSSLTQLSLFSSSCFLSSQSSFLTFETEIFYPFRIFVLQVFSIMFVRGHEAAVTRNGEERKTEEDADGRLSRQ
jgi:hypothetical protein